MKISYKASANKLSTYGGKGVVSTLFIPQTVSEFVNLIKEYHGEVSLLGGGSNTLIPDGEYTSKVVSTSGLNHLEIDGNVVRAGCGTKVSALLAEMKQQSLSGLEFLVGIPATVGGIVKMNAGAFSAETADYLHKLTVLTPDYEIKEIFPPFNFGYRKGANNIVLEAEFSLENSFENAAERMKEFLLKRRQTQPRARSLGCTFKNPGLGAGYYIDCCGLKGVCHGGAEISKVHANFIVNRGEGSAEDYLFLCDLARKRVYETFGVTLEREFTILGEEKY